MMKALRNWICLLLLLPLQAAFAQVVEIEVREPFIELHTSPGRGYPVFDVAERGERVQLLKRRTQWFKVRTSRSGEGWVSQEQMTNSLKAAGYLFDPAGRPVGPGRAAAPPRPAS